MAVSLKNFSSQAEQLILAAQQAAKQFQHLKVEPSHLLEQVFQSSAHLHECLPTSMHEQLPKVRDALYQLIQSFPPHTESVEQAYISRQLQAVLVRAEKEAYLLGSDEVGIGHLILSLLLNESPARQVLWRHGVQADDVKRQLKANMMEEGTSDIFNQYCTNLTQLAYEKKLDPVLGRHDEVRTMIQVLSRRHKNNPILVGEPGVGKTALVEGLAVRIADNDVPQSLRDKQLLSLDLGSLIAGTSYRGEFESRLKELLHALESSAGEYLLFIDEIHMLMGAGGAEGRMDAANLLKPSLSRGQLHCIGATTLKEFKRYIEKDAALVRRFQKVMVSEPDISTTLTILRGVKEQYEVHHGVPIKDAALVAAAELSERYITERFLPDKALDLVDAACANLRMQMDALPAEMEELSRKIKNLEVEQAALLNEGAKTSQKKLAQIQSTLLNLEEQKQYLSQQWEEEQHEIQEIRNIKASIVQIKQQEQDAQSSGNLELAAKLHYETLGQLLQQLKHAQQHHRSHTTPLLKDEVDAEEIANMVAQWTGIPVSKVMQHEKEKLLDMETALHEKVIGQPIAVSKVTHAIRRSRAGIQDPQKPIGSFIFQGGSGVGKTALAYALAEFLFDDSKALIRFDMSEYSEKQSTTRLIGAAPGFVGYEEGGLLTEAIRQRPYAVLLFDEIEKAHKEVFDLFLQILDDGHLTDSQGRTVSFKNALIIMTTNLGHNEVRKSQKVDKEEETQEVAHSTLLKHFRPEFLNRVDDVIVFHDLSLSHIHQITRIQIQEIQTYLNPQNIQIELTDAAYTYLAKRGYDARFGARPLKRVIQREIQDPLADQLLEGTLNANQRCVIDVAHSKLSFQIVSE